MDVNLLLFPLYKIPTHSNLILFLPFRIYFIVCLTIEIGVSTRKWVQQPTLSPFKTMYILRLQHFWTSISKPSLHPVALRQQIPFHPPSCTSQEEIVFGYQLYTIPNDRLLCLRWRRGKVTRVSVYMVLQGSKKNGKVDCNMSYPFFESSLWKTPQSFPFVHIMKQQNELTKFDSKPISIETFSALRRGSVPKSRSKSTLS